MVVLAAPGNQDADFASSIGTERGIGEYIVWIPDLLFAEHLHRADVHTDETHVSVWKIKAVRRSFAITRGPPQPQLISGASAGDDGVSR